MLAASAAAARLSTSQAGTAASTLANSRSGGDGSAKETGGVSRGADAAAVPAALDAAELPALLPELWGAIARATVAAEGGTFESLARLSLVGVAWRDGLKGESHLTLTGSRSCRSNAASSVRLCAFDGSAVVASLATCQHVMRPNNGCFARHGTYVSQGCQSSSASRR